MIIEACVENYTEASEAYKKGATRIELCENLSVGGTTPSYGAIKHCVNELPIPILVMIRPRGGNFVYSKDEIDIMITEIKQCKLLNVYGVVFGCLTSDNKINYPQMEELIEHAENMKVVMHRAYDELEEGHKEIFKLSKIGVNAILSAGGKTTFYDGLSNLEKTLTECNKHNVSLTAAGKITSENLEDVKKKLPCNQYHGRAIIKNASYL